MAGSAQKTDDSGKLPGRGSQVPHAQPVTDGKCLVCPRQQLRETGRRPYRAGLYAKSQTRLSELNWMCFSTGRSHINFNCLPGAIIVMRSGSCRLRNQPQEFPRAGKGWQLPSRNPVGYSSGGGQVSQMPCTKQHFSSQECKAPSQMAHLFSNNF